MSSSIVVPAEVYSRVSGYFRPVNQWNKGKQEEFINRATVNVDCLTAGMISSSPDSIKTPVSIS
jgi:hypothetical protein